MWVTTVKIGDVVKVGDDIEIELLDIQGYSIRLGVTAPAHITINRQEVQDAITRDGRIRPSHSHERSG